MKRTSIAALALLFAALPTLAADEIKVTKVLSDLNDPTSVVIRPGGSAESYEVFVAESGARRVIKIASDKPDATEVVITDFPESEHEVNDATVGNPRGLLFLDHERLVTGIVDESLEVRLFELGDAKMPAVADKPKQAVNAEMPDGNSDRQLGSFVAFTRTRANDFVGDMLIVASTERRSSPTLWKLPIRANTLSTMTPLDGAAGSESANSVSALTINPQGYLVCATQSDDRLGSELAFQNPKSGQVVMRQSVKLKAVAGLAYSPKSGNLFVIGASQSRRNERGIFRIDAQYSSQRPDDTAVVEAKIVEIVRPAALAFGPDGALYVASQGESSNDGSRRGTLVKLTGEL